MARISFFSIPENRKFSYKPRYYDPAKEHVKELEEKYGAQKKEPERYIPGMAIRKAYRDGSIQGETASQGNKLLRRLLVFAGVILAFLVAYYIAKGLTIILK